MCAVHALKQSAPAAEGRILKIHSPHFCTSRIPSQQQREHNLGSLIGLKCNCVKGRKGRREFKMAEQRYLTLTCFSNGEIAPEVKVLAMQAWWLQSNPETHIKMGGEEGGEVDGSVVGSIGFSSRGPIFTSQHPHGNSQPSNSSARGTDILT